MFRAWEVREQVAGVDPAGGGVEALVERALESVSIGEGEFPDMFHTLVYASDYQIAYGVTALVEAKHFRPGTAEFNREMPGRRSHTRARDDTRVTTRIVGMREAVNELRPGPVGILAVVDVPAQFSALPFVEDVHLCHFLELVGERLHLVHARGDV